MTPFRGTQAELAEKFADAAKRARLEVEVNPARSWAVLAYEAAASLVRTAIITEEPKS